MSRPAEIPILMQGWQVRALLDGRMTETRRLLGGPPPECPDHGTTCEDLRFERCEWPTGDVWTDGWTGYRRCPYGQPGDLLYVRETFCVVDDSEYGGGQWIDFRATPRYSAEHPAGWDAAPDDPEALKWHASIHMPKRFTRIWLRRKGEARVERVKAITEMGAITEGATSRIIDGRWGKRAAWSMDWSRVGAPSKYGTGGVLTEADIGMATARLAFANAWERIYGPGAWERNDWVWVAPFSVASTRERP